jgi:hypothetical protein
MEALPVRPEKIRSHAQGGSMEGGGRGAPRGWVDAVFAMVGDRYASLSVPVTSDVDRVEILKIAWKLMKRLHSYIFVQADRPLSETR